MTTETERLADPTLRVVEACHEPWSRAWEELGERTARNVVEPLAQGRDRHREVVTTIGLEADPPRDWTERTDRLVEYRRAIGSGPLGPLADLLAEPGLAGQIAQLFGETLESARGAVGELPAEVTSEWPAGALEPRPSDNFGRRMGKVLARGVSAARKAGRERSLPLRAVAVLHLAENVTPGQDDAVAQAMSAWAAWAGRLERAWIQWADSALPALIQAELPDGEQTSELWASLREAALSLDAELTALIEETPHQAAAAAAEHSLGRARGVLEADVAVAGSFLYPNGRTPKASLTRMARSAPALQAWDRDAGSRLRLYGSILAILSGATAVQRRVVQRCREESLSKADDLYRVAAGLRELERSLEGGGAKGLADRVASLDAKINETLQPALGAVPRPAQVAAALTEVADSAVDALLNVIRQAATTLQLHDPRVEPPVQGRRVELRTLPLQELARQSFDALRIERIRSSTEGLLSAIGGVRTDLEGLPEVFAFARDEALRELDSEEEDPEKQATELIVGAVERMAASLETRVEDLEKAIGGAQQRLAAEITDGSMALLGRVGAGRMQAQLLRARSRAADLIAWVTDRWGPPVRRLLARVRSLLRRARERVAGLAARISTLLGHETPAEVTTTRSIQSLAEVQALVERLPLVYQRLFTLEPISDPALLAGRDATLDVAMARWHRWREGEGVPLLVKGRQRSGITSLLRVLGGRIQAEGNTHVAVTLGDRTASEEALAGRLAKELGIPRAATLDDLAHAIFAADESSLPGAVTVDNLEHLYLRVPAGTDVVERFLTLMAETEPRIFWIGGVTSSAWQLISATEPTAVSQVDVMDLPPLDAASIRAAILARHRRSGLDVHYEESVTARARLRRRLRRIRDKKGFRKTLEDEFFAQLHRASGGYLGLALFLWLQSARFDPDEGVIMELPQRPDFSLLDQLSLTQNFTLKAFLEHRTLTIEEHDRIFRLPHHESYQVFESLRNRQLIEEVAASRDSQDDQSDIEVDIRYRVRPLLTGAVLSHLQGRNIVH